MLIFGYFLTLFIQVEAILISRPLSSMSPDPRDYYIVTSSHFLIGRPLTSIPEHDLSDIPKKILDLYQHILQIWNRWSQEYITELQQRKRWLVQGEPNIHLG